MDHWKKVYELGGRLGFVRGLFEFTANHVHYLKIPIPTEKKFKKPVNMYCTYAQWIHDFLFSDFRFRFDTTLIICYP